MKIAGVLLGATALLFAGLVGQARAGDVLFAVLRGLPGFRLYRLWSTGAEIGLPLNPGGMRARFSGGAPCSTC